MDGWAIDCQEKIPVKNKVKELREQRGLSQAEFGQKIGVSRQTVYAIEIGKYDPSLPLAFQIAKHFGRRIEDIFDPKS
jgi:putative transcriptional regulator